MTSYCGGGWFSFWEKRKCFCSNLSWDAFSLLKPSHDAIVTWFQRNTHTHGTKTVIEVECIFFLLFFYLGVPCVLVMALFQWQASSFVAVCLKHTWTCTNCAFKPTGQIVWWMQELNVLRLNLVTMYLEGQNESVCYNDSLSSPFPIKWPPTWTCNTV